jgi:hypothetical protein
MRWSWSGYDAYGTCPKKWHATRIEKRFVEEETPYQVWGVRVHEALELAVRDGTPLPEEMEQWEKLCEQLRCAPGEHFCEMELGLTSKLLPCAFDAEDVWLRGIVDFASVNGAVAVALDYKTGKRKLTDQLKLMALLIFARFPDVDEVHTGFLWLQTGKLDQELYKREEIPRLWRSFLPRLQQMKESFKLDVWPAKPSGLCRGWCPVKDCAYNSAYKKHDY